MRVYTPERLEGESKETLRRMLDSVKTNIHLSREEVDANIDVLMMAIDDGVRPINEQVIQDIKAGQADISDMEGH